MFNRVCMFPLRLESRIGDHNSYIKRCMGTLSDPVATGRGNEAALVASV